MNEDIDKIKSNINSLMELLTSIMIKSATIESLLIEKKIVTNDELQNSSNNIAKLLIETMERHLKK